MKDKVLVTGGAGYIGSALVEILLKKNYRVVVLDNFMYKNEKVFDKLKSKNLKVVKGDVTKSKDLRKALRNVNKIVHLAGLVGDPACSLNPELTHKINVEGTRLLLKEAKSQKISNFIFASSCSVYGVTNRTASEKTKPNPISLYSESKIISENDVLNAQDKKMSITILRFSTIFGLSKRPRFDLAANIFTADAFYKNRISIQGGAQWRPFIHVRDVASAIELVLSSPSKKIRGEIFNIGDDKMVITISELAKKIKSTLNLKIKITKEKQRKDARDYRVSFKKIKSTLGFEKQISFEDGILEMAEFFKLKKNLDYQKYIYSNAETLKKYLTKHS